MRKHFELKPFIETISKHLRVNLLTSCGNWWKRRCTSCLPLSEMLHSCLPLREMLHSCCKWYLWWFVNLFHKVSFLLVQIHHKAIVNLYLFASLSCSKRLNTRPWKLSAPKVQHVSRFLVLYGKWQKGAKCFQFHWYKRCIQRNIEYLSPANVGGLAHSIFGVSK